MTTHEDSEPIADFLVEHLREVAARVIELIEYINELDVKTEQYNKGMEKLAHVSWTMANSFNSLDDTLRDGGQLPVSWSRPEAPKPRWRRDSAGNVKVGWVLHYDGADRVVREVTIHRRESGENDRRVTMQFDGMRAWGDENQIVYVVSEGRPSLYGMTSVPVDVTGAQADELDRILKEET